MAIKVDFEIDSNQKLYVNSIAPEPLSPPATAITRSVRESLF